MSNYNPFEDDYWFGSSWGERVPDMGDNKIHFDAMWQMSDAIDLIRKLQPRAWELGYHLNFGGGVLNKGYSYKDLDILAMYVSARDQRPEIDLVFEFIKLGFENMEKDTKFPGVTVFKLSNATQKIDLIFVNKNE